LNKSKRIDVDLIKKIEMSNSKLAKEVLKVQLLSYRVEAALIDSDEIPPLRDTVDRLQQCGESFYGYFTDDKLSGVISIKIINGVMDIHRLFVHPNHFRNGIAQLLLDFVQASEKGVETVIVSTGTKNVPAIHFYQKNGFSKTKEIKVTECLSLTFFVKKL
jgi:ribosomal protein S18 acetylase RimI-like enzyme